MSHRVDEVPVATPIMTFRVPLDQQDAVRQIVQAIKTNPAVTPSLIDVIHANGHRNVGPFRSEQAALSFLAGRLTATLHPEAIFLFGSRAADTAQPDSDFDLLVILVDEHPVDHATAYAPVAGCGIGVDVVACGITDFEADRHQPGTIAHAADSGGRLLYARPGGPFRQRYREGQR